MSDDGKFDKGKTRYRYIQPEWEKAIAEILTQGAETHGDESWKSLPDARNRYYDALRRHINAWQLGEITDTQSGQHHLYHAAVNCMFIAWLEWHGEGKCAHGIDKSTCPVCCPPIKKWVPHYLERFAKDTVAEDLRVPTIGGGPDGRNG